MLFAAMMASITAWTTPGSIFGMVVSVGMVGLICLIVPLLWSESECDGRRALRRRAESPGAMKRIEKVKIWTLERSWGTETVVIETGQYLGKVLRYRAGHAGGLQLHRTKDEAFFMHRGTALIDSDDGTGLLMTRQMGPGESCHIPAGAPHRFQAITDCVVFEVSTPVHDDRVRLEEHYGVPVIGDAYGLETTEP